MATPQDDNTPTGMQQMSADADASLAAAARSRHVQTESDAVEPTTDSESVCSHPPVAPVACARLQASMYESYAHDQECVARALDAKRKGSGSGSR
jgi:hypothetical protein